MSKLLRFTLMVSLSLASLPLVASAQTAIVDKAVPQAVDLTNVIRAQHIKPGDVSPEEYQDLLNEAEKVKTYQMVTQPAYSNSHAQVQSVYDGAPYVSNQIAPQTQQQSHYQDTTTYLYDNTPTAIVTHVQNDDNGVYQYEENTQTAAATGFTGTVNQYEPVLLQANSTSGYVVMRGDTLYNIAKRNGVSLQKLKSVNGLTSNDLAVGQMLSIPTSQVITYRSNPSYHPKAAIVGNSSQVIRASDAAPSNIYAVLPGDTIYSISRQACADSRQIAQINGLDANATIWPGQRLNLPLGHCLR